MDKLLSTKMKWVLSYIKTIIIIGNRGFLEKYGLDNTSSNSYNLQGALLSSI
jgi:hypothetical protein